MWIDAISSVSIVAANSRSTSSSVAVVVAVMALFLRSRSVSPAMGASWVSPSVMRVTPALWYWMPRP